jgi:hypothetical protein
MEVGLRLLEWLLETTIGLETPTGGPRVLTLGSAPPAPGAAVVVRTCAGAATSGRAPAAAGEGWSGGRAGAAAAGGRRGWRGWRGARSGCLHPGAREGRTDIPCTGQRSRRGGCRGRGAG